MLRRIVRKGGPAPVSARVNNFDLIRILAALQVVYLHGYEHLQLKHPPAVRNALGLFPGVPVFYFLSGILISMSWENAPQFGTFVRNRALRIFPALVAVTLLSVTGLFVIGYLNSNDVTRPTFLVWVVGQMTVLQFYTPDFMRGFGSGALNGSLPTITVELQFYALVPLLYTALRLTKRTRKTSNALLGALIVVFAIANHAYNEFGGQGSETMAMKLLNVSFVPWFYMFLCGVFVQRNFQWFASKLQGTGLILLGAYFVFGWVVRGQLGWQISNALNPVTFVVLAATIFAVAYSLPTLADQLLHRNDISYGVYIWHMPLFNLMMHEQLIESTADFLHAVIIVLALAGLSWLIVERPMTRRKRSSIRLVQPAISVQ